MAEEDQQMEVEVQEEEESPMTVIDALKEVLKKAAVYDGLRRGLHEYVFDSICPEHALCCVC